MTSYPSTPAPVGPMDGMESTAESRPGRAHSYTSSVDDLGKGSTELVYPQRKILDLFCGAGGCAAGYHRAGFTVTGVDIVDQPRYPFEFIQADALDVLTDRAFLAGFDAIHASPPCQAYSPLNAYNRVDYPDLIDTVRARVRASGLPYVIENVPQAPLHKPVILCAQTFGLGLYRHRGFESNLPLTQPAHRPHVALCARNGYLPTVERPYMTISGGKHSKAWQRTAAERMGVPWMTEIRETCEAIPPAYSEFVGQQLLIVLTEEAA